MEKITLTPEQHENTVLVAGIGHPELSQDIAKAMDLPLLGIEEKLHGDGEIFSRYSESIRGKHVFFIQSHVRSMIGERPTSLNDAIIQQYLMTDAAYKSSAAEITSVNALFGYQRQDRRTQGGEPLSAGAVLRLLRHSHADRVVTMDMHTQSTQNAFDGPFDHITAQPLLRRVIQEELAGYDPAEIMVVAPDSGASKMAERHRREMGSSLLHLAKFRGPAGIVRDTSVPEARDKVCVIYDDMIDTGGTLVSAANLLKDSGAKAIYVAATHGLFSGPAFDKLRDAPIERIVISNTVPVRDAVRELGDKLRVVDVAPIIGESLLRIRKGMSVSAMYDGQNYI